MRIRFSLAALGLILALAPVAGAKDDPTLTPDQQLDAAIAKHREAIGDAHYKIAKWCRSKKYHRTAHAHWVIGLHFHPEDRTARRTLGYKKTDGEWVLAKPIDLDKVEDEDRPPPEYVERLDEIRSDRVKELMKLVDRAKALGLDARAQELVEKALRVDPESEVVRKALGHVQIADRWFTPDEAAALSTTIEIERSPGVTPISSGLGLPVQQYRAQRFFVEGNGSEEHFRHVLEGEVRTYEFIRRLRGGRDWLPANAQIGFLAMGDLDKFKAYVDQKTDLDETSRRYAKEGGHMRDLNGGAIVAYDFVEAIGGHADRMSHIVAAHGMGASRSDAWLLQGFTDFVCGRIIGSMATRFVQVQRTGGGDSGSSKRSDEVWRRFLLQSVALGTDGRTELLFQSSLSGLESRDVTKAWSIVSFFYERDWKKMIEFISKAEGGATADAFAEVWGMSIDQVDREWRAYVIEHY